MRLSNIQHGSTGDGPGLRTTVFFAGCGLRCGWCHNPETWSVTPRLLYYAARCAHCGVCAMTCPTGAHTFADGVHTFDRSRCTACGGCTGLCPTGAVALTCTDRSLEDVLAEIDRDASFYAASGGGVTLSGGEPLLQDHDCIALADACRTRGYHVLLDTAGDLPEERFREALSHVDAVYLDAKAPDAPSFRLHTGGDFDRVLRNTAFACQNHPDVTLRIPLIPGVNLERIGELGARLRECDGSRLCLIPFHRLGSGKYTALDMTYPYAGMEPLPKASLKAAAAVLEAMGFTVTLE